jgi:hypothetical protein
VDEREEVPEGKYSMSQRQTDWNDSDRHDRHDGDHRAGDHDDHHHHHHHHHPQNPPPQVLTYTGNSASSTFLASDPNNWVPAATPQPGDTLIMHPVDINSGSMTVTNDALAGTVLMLTVDAGVNSAGISIDPTSTVNLTADTTGFINTSGGGTLNFIGSSNFMGAGQFFTDTNLTGNGILDLQGNPTALITSETMEFGSSVGSGLTFNVVGAPGGPPDVTMRIDHPDTFGGQITLPSIAGDLDAVIFAGVQASRGQLRNDILTLFDGSNNVIDTTRVSGGPGVGGADGLELQVTVVGTSLTEINHTTISGAVIPLTT